MDAFLEVAEFGIQQHDTYDPGVFVERTDGRGILVKIMERIGACFTSERFCLLLHTRGANVEGSLHAYLQSLDWAQFGSGGNLSQAGPYLYYDWVTILTVNVGKQSFC